MTTAGGVGDCAANAWETRRLLAAGHAHCEGGCGRLIPPDRDGDYCESCTEEGCA